VAVQQTQQRAGVLNARIADVQHAMDQRLNSPAAYVRTAASMSPDAYDRFVASRRGDWQYDRLVSYRSVSEEMVGLNKQMSDLRAEQAGQDVTASVSSEVNTARTSTLNSIMNFLNTFWILLLAFVMDIVCLLIPWIRELLIMKRNEQLAAAGPGTPLPKGFQIEDHSEDEPLETEPMAFAKEMIVDAEWKDPKRAEAAIKGWETRKNKAKAKTTKDADGTEYETGVFDASRTGQSEKSTLENINAGEDQLQAGESGDGANQEAGADSANALQGFQDHTPDPTPSATTEEDLAALDALYADEAPMQEIALPNGEGTMVAESEAADAHVREWERSAQAGAKQLENAE
jgi:hypothetical protein